MWGWQPGFPEGTALVGRSHGSAYPESGTPGRANRDLNFLSPDRAVRAAARTAVRRARRVRAGCAPATTPMRPSRVGRLDDCEIWLGTDEGRAACARQHGTERHCAVTGAVAVMAAGCWPRTVVATW